MAFVIIRPAFPLHLLTSLISALSANMHSAILWPTVLLSVVSSGYTGLTKADKRIGQKRRQKTAAWLLCGHMFLLCGAGPYVCIGWLWAWGSAICFYYAALGYMFLLVGCRRGTGPYVSIV